MSSYWQGKRAVVVGGSEGLGFALARVLVASGARVAIVGRRAEALARAGAQLRQAGGEVVEVRADATIGQDIERLQGEINQAFDEVDFVCHAAGKSTRGDVMATSPEAFRELWEINFLAAVRLCQAFAPRLASTRGHFVLIGSLASKFAPRYLGGYPSSKFAVAALAQQLRLELGPQGVHVMLVCPGPIARGDKVPRYEGFGADVPEAAQRPGGGAKVSAIDPGWLSQEILKGCERRRPELVIPRKARLLAGLSQLSPRLGDRLLRRSTAG